MYYYQPGFKSSTTYKFNTMKTSSSLLVLLYLCLFSCYNIASGQITQGVYIHKAPLNDTVVTHELKIANDYLIYTTYKEVPPEFISTVGGFYSLENDTIKVKLEFNSNYENNVITKIALPYEVNGSNLILDGKAFEAIPQLTQDLDGQWLFATRGPDTGQERRGEANARKTLKFLLNGRFQWIAYHTETYRFSGTGGGTFSAKDGKYIENIGYFSRDNNRVGAELDFMYEVKGNDWHHTGKNSKGAPMYEIWARRD